MKKMVLKVDLPGDQSKKKALNAVSTLSGILAVEMDDGKMTVTGKVDPVVVVAKLRKTGWRAEILTVGPAKEDRRINVVPIDHPIAAHHAYYYNPQFYCHLPPAADDNANGCVIC